MSTAMRFWLMKTEPSVFSFEDLFNSPDRTTAWEGVRNYQARNLMRDEFHRGDQVLIYHSSTTPPAVVGIAEVVREGYPDETALDPKSRYLDELSLKRGISSWIKVDVKAVRPLKVPVTLEDLKKIPSLSEMMVLKRGSRLSVQPVTQREFQTIVKMGLVLRPRVVAPNTKVNAMRY